LHFMVLFQSTYSNFLILAMALLLAVPCTLKQNTKQLLNIELTTSPNSAKSKIACTTYKEVKENIKQVQAEKQLRPLASKVNTLARVTVEQLLILPDFYNTYKEKIPSHLIFERFLI